MSSVACQFCGSDRKPSSPTFAESSPTKGSKTLQWLRSDQPKRVAAEWILIVSVLALMILVISSPGELERANTTAVTDPEDLADVAPEMDTENQPPEINSPNLENDSPAENFEKDEEAVEEESSPNVENSSGNQDVPIESSLADDSERDNFMKWLDSFSNRYEEPARETGGDCVSEDCVRERLLFIFEDPALYSLDDISVTIRVASHDSVSPSEKSFLLTAGQEDFVYTFVNEDPGDLGNYLGDYLVEVSFPYFGTRVDIETENRVFNLYN